MLRAFIFMFIFYPLTMILAFAPSSAPCSTAPPAATISSLPLEQESVWGSPGYGAGGRPGKGARRRAGHLHEQSPGNFDIFALYQAIPRKFAWLAKEELFKIPVFGHSMSRAGYIPSIGGGAERPEAMAYAAERIRSGPAS